ncbi:secretory carrier-associated membrane protein 5 [Platysternon megacephalum]|uniref:Secretory carrier-associated membrane protein 5 n=1 Tax=Platysternon megacephalum TaxID=55544 RepID=A0A4D9EAA9_9SAUR|nr:secretory carrier-associated membrane protein 5 [Platysternon megacephalum]
MSYCQITWRLKNPCLEFWCIYHDLKCLSIFFFLSEPFQLPLWGLNRDVGLSHSRFPQQQSIHEEAPQALRSEGVIDGEREQAVSPRPCHRLREHNFDFNRTRNIQEFSEAT